MSSGLGPDDCFVSQIQASKFMRRANGRYKSKRHKEQAVNYARDTKTGQWSTSTDQALADIETKKEEASKETKS